VALASTGRLTAMDIHSLARPSFTEHHVTVIGTSARPETATGLFEELATACAARGVLPLHEKICGPVAQRDSILAARQQVLAAQGWDPELPCTFVDGKPGRNGRGPLAVQLWGIEPGADGAASVVTVSLPGQRRGRLLEAPGLRVLVVGEITGADPSGALPPTPTVQASQMFRSADQALADQGMTFGKVARTWLYLRRLLDWYGGLNEVRTAFFAERNITGKPPGLPFPASTGIQGTAADEECVMDVLAIDVAEGRGGLRPLDRSRRQHEAFAYGSAFSRAMAWDYEGCQTIWVSGTASIDSQGRSRHRDDPEAQLTETLQSIAALLEPAGASLADIGAGTFFYKDTASRHVYERVCAQLGLPKLPLVPVLADVCRDELLVEIEAVALVASPAAAPATDGGEAATP